MRIFPILISILSILILGFLIIIAIKAYGQTQTQEAKFETGTTVTLTQTCCPGYVFSGWTGDCAFAKKNKTCTIKMDGDKTVGMNCLRGPKNLKISDTDIIKNCENGKTGYISQANFK
jgi:uncharacterized repeat protein (TIGR02543 family)